MTTSRAARRYAQALMDLAEDKKMIDRIVADSELIASTAKGSREFNAFLKSPVIKTEKKKETLSAVFKASVSAEMMDFLNLLCDKNREDVLLQMLEQFFSLRDEKQGIVSVDVKAATELSSEQHKVIERRFEQMTKKKVRIQFSIDKQLKGGFVARVGDTVFDGSIVRQLEVLRKRFAEGTAQNEQAR
jgi:F-type H+-transporting ATPase subunit delta